MNDFKSYCYLNMVFPKQAAAEKFFHEGAAANKFFPEGAAAKQFFHEAAAAAAKKFFQLPLNSSFWSKGISISFMNVTFYL